MDYSNFEDWEINALAKRNGQSAEEWKAEQDALVGKETVPEATTPPTEPEKKKKKNAAAGESSSAGTSLESPELSRQQKFQEIEAEINATSIDDLRKTYSITDIEIEDFQYFYPDKSVDDYIRQTALTLKTKNYK